MPAELPPPDRYGRRPTGRPSWLRLVGGVLVVLALGAVAIVAYRAFAGQPIVTEQTGFTVVSPSQVRIEFTVTRDQPQRPADCVVTARARTGEETGRREVYVPPGPETTSQTTLLRTGRAAVSAEVYGCTYDVPEYLIPDQPPSG